MVLQCTGCGAGIASSEHFVKFNCPSCAKTEIVRCEKCKLLFNEYKCKECGFTGP